MDFSKVDLKAVFLNYHCITDGFKVKHGIDLDLRNYEGISDKNGVWCF